MRKNKFMRAASGLLVAVLLTTCVISGTFAKYTTSSTGTDSARVATWGFNETDGIKLTDLFKTAYDKNVQGTADVIAPGTTNSANFTFKYTGQEAAPEVAYTFKVDTTGSSCADDIQKNKNIVWALDGKEFTTDTTSTSWQKLLNAIEALSGDSTGSKEYAANELPGEVGNKTTVKTHTVTWKWNYESDEEGNTADTKMGNKSELDKVVLKITISAEQID